MRDPGLLVTSSGPRLHRIVGPLIGYPHTISGLRSSPKKSFFLHPITSLNDEQARVLSVRTPRKLSEETIFSDFRYERQCRTGHIVEVAFAGRASACAGAYRTYPQLITHS
ncbi:hypothetical protein EVAR_34326_1 [Eumeta japonica]|uniref:Uncharacterized protein n=1 Tax=Eumeta variegata TaxID=151549 RepID=A0A4C1VD72_EUMVA|nr:hypothetical protein EVAR_34326_1 [Eumeta japonica]